MSIVEKVRENINKELPLWDQPSIAVGIVKDGKVVAAFAALGSRPNGAAGDTKYGIVTTDGTTTTKDGDP